jgi:hypothetical protein
VVLEPLKDANVSKSERASAFEGYTDFETLCGSRVRRGR